MIVDMEKRKIRTSSKYCTEWTGTKCTSILVAKIMSQVLFGIGSSHIYRLLVGYGVMDTSSGAE